MTQKSSMTLKLFSIIKSRSRRFPIRNKPEYVLFTVQISSEKTIAYEFQIIMLKMNNSVFSFNRIEPNLSEKS
jgi:hypothetical protein